jgi:hypothetical protein
MISGFNMNLLDIGSEYEISNDTRNDIKNMILEHLKFTTQLTRRATGLTLHKMKWTNSRLFEALNILKSSVRGSLMPGGRSGLQYFVSVLLGGILVDFVDPNYTPPDPPADAVNDIGGRAPIQILDVCVQKMQKENLKLSVEQIRNKINDRVDKEKRMIINRFAVLTPEEKRVEKMKQKLGLDEWAVGGTKAIRAYDDEQYKVEAQQRQKMGFDDFQADTIDYSAVNEDEGGYDNRQVGEDDW